MKTQFDALQTVYTLIANQNTGYALYKLKKPTKNTDSKFIVVNALPIGAGVMQFCTANINCHAKDLAPGIPDIDTLETITTTLVEYFKKYNGTGFMIDFETNETFQDEALGSHYSNIRIKVKIINN